MIRTHLSRIKSALDNPATEATASSDVSPAQESFVRLLDFVNTVQSMRTAQKNFFATRSDELLTLAKEYERRVDELLAPQETLF